MNESRDADCKSTWYVTYLENMTNSRKDLVGKAQLCITDHVSAFIGMGGRDSKVGLIPYILRRASETANLYSARSGMSLVRYYLNNHAILLSSVRPDAHVTEP